MLNNAADPGLVLCVGLSLNEIAGIARLLQDRAVVLGAVDVAAARTLLEPAAGSGATTPTSATAAGPTTNLHTSRSESDPPPAAHRPRVITAAPTARRRVLAGSARNR